MRNKIPFYLITFNRWSGIHLAKDYARRATIDLELGILDMGSTNPKFWKEIEDIDVPVLFRGNGDIGPRELWSSGVLASLGVGSFFISDADLDYSEVHSSAFECIVSKSEKYPWIPKVGLALSLNDFIMDDDGSRIKQWELPNWRVKFDSDSFLCGIDTTLCYCNTRSADFFYRPALRMNSKGSANHYPWSERSNSLSDEAAFYWRVAGAISTTVNRREYTKKMRLHDEIRVATFRLFRKLLKRKTFGSLVVRLLSAI